MQLSRFQWAAFLLLVVASAALFLYHLGAAPLQDYDEAQYAIVTDQMVASHDWLDLRFIDHAYFEKPPMYFWLAGMSESAFGHGEWQLRLPSALAGIGLVILVVLLTYELLESRGVASTQDTVPKAKPFGSAWAAILAGAIELTLSPVLDTARQMRVDVLVTFFIVLAAYAFLKARKDARYFYLFGVAAACAVLTKGVIAVFAFVAALSFAYWMSDNLPQAFAILRKKEFWWGMGVFVVLALSWHLYELARYGGAFWETYITFNLFARTSHNLFPITVTNYDYAWYLANMAWPWTQLAVPALIGLVTFWRQIEQPVRGAAAACFTVMVIIGAIFFSSATKAPTYLTPLYPFLAVMLAMIGYAAFAGLRSSVVARSAMILGVLGFLALGLTSDIYNGFHYNPYFAPVSELSAEERAIGTRAAQKTSEAATNKVILFAYGDPPMGSIMYYSNNLHPLALALPPVPGSYIVMPTSAQNAFYQHYSQTSTELVYQGQQLELLEVMSED